jgi:Rieske 2Fe-2S family protein
MIIDQLESPLPGSLMPTLAGPAYTDEAVYAAEQEKIFERMWFCAVRGSDIQAPGAHKVVQVGRESVIVSRNRKGEARAFFNVCRHRGMQVCQGESSDGQRSFQCGYHAWTYDLDGKLIAAPNLTKMPDIDREDYGLRTLAVREWLGYVWVCVADEPPSFEETVLTEVVDRLGEVSNLDHYAVDTLAVGRRIVYDVKANWKLIIENFMECYHCATIHPELTEVLPEFADGLAAQVFVNHGAAFGDEIKGFTIDGSPGFEPLLGVSDDQQRSTTPSLSSRRSSSTWCPTTSSSTGCSRFRPTARSSSVTGSMRRVSSRAGPTSRHPSNCSTGSIARTSRLARRPSHRCRHGCIATAECSCRPSITSPSSTSGTAQCSRDDLRRDSPCGRRADSRRRSPPPSGGRAAAVGVGMRGRRRRALRSRGLPRRERERRSR